jgi:parvulin-like peptidyl-prolyl isomerase
VRHAFIVALALAGCASADTLTSKDVMGRPAAAEQVEVKQVLVAWDDTAHAYKGKLDDAAKARAAEQAEALVKTLLAELGGGASFEEAMAKHSSDPGTAKDGGSYTVDAAQPYEPRFIKLSLRLAPGEVGVVRTRYGYHVLKRFK